VDGRHAVEGRQSLRFLVWDGPCGQVRRGWRGAPGQSEDENENGTGHRRTRSGSSRRDDGRQMEGPHVDRI
jgi:hypothetical protein